MSCGRSRAPRIGIPMCIDTQHRVRARSDALYIAPAYARGIAEAGGVALHLPPQPEVEPLLDAVDGLLFPGGGDFMPAAPYASQARFDPVSPQQLEFDRRLLRAALERGMPVLGICYGMQLLALELGGTLVYDIPTERADAGPHQLAPGESHGLMWCGEASRLEAALAPLVVVNSRHHQAVADPGPRLRCVARASDGVIEAIESSAGPLWAGVQWHPEDALDEHGLRLFRLLIETAARGLDRHLSVSHRTA